MRPGLTLGSILLGAFLIAGSLQAFILPPFQVPDEPALQTKPILAPVLLAIAWMDRDTLSLRSPRQLGLVSLALYGIGYGLFSGALGGAGYQGNPPLQKAHILAHPVEVGVMLLKTALLHTFTFNRWLLGKLGWLDHISSESTQWAFGLLILLTVIFGVIQRIFRTPSPQPALDDPSPRPTGIKITFFLASWVGSVCLIPLALYLSWTQPGAGHVDGLQGRYFFPHLTLFFALIYRVVPSHAVASVRTSVLPQRLIFTIQTLAALLAGTYVLTKTIDTLTRYH